MFFLVEKMERLVPQQCNVRMLGEKIVDRSRAGFLHTGDDKAHPINLSALKAPDGRQCARERLPVYPARFDL